MVVESADGSTIVGGAEQLVGGVVVDHQHLAAGFGELTQRAEPVDAGNVDGDHQVGVAAHVVRRDEQVPARQRLQGFGQSGRFGEADLDVLARVVQHKGQRQAGADGVGVGIDVADDADGAQRQTAARRRHRRRRADLPGLRQSSDRSRSTVSSASRLLIRLPADLLRPRHTVRVLVAGVLGTLPNSRQILICGAGAGQQLLHVGGGIRHLVEDERQRRRESDTDGWRRPWCASVPFARSSAAAAPA